ncbi:VanZ family protein [Agathobaculum sp. Marseille-P7918]|uniref:VanZ family protein n=1 Tax=Agathobaculum sp. Marseille-P7918 TaxID=2479843 RepID=UPI003568B439
MRRRDLCGVLLLMVYLLGVGLVTGPSLYQLLMGRLPEPKLELIPFSDIIGVIEHAITHHHGADITLNIFGNIILFVPLGLVLPLFWQYFDRARHTILFAAGLSLSIELIQLVAGGVTSVDDLILNTAGAAIGFVLAKLLLRACPRLKPQKERGAQWVYPFACWFMVIVMATVMDVMTLGMHW